MGNKYQVDIDVKLNKQSAMSELNQALNEIKKNAKIELDIKGSTSKLNDLKKSLNSLSKLNSGSLREVNAQISKLSENLGKLGTVNAKGLNTISKSITNLGKELNTINKLEFGNLTKLSSGIEKLAKSFNSIETVNIEGVTQLKNAINEVKSGLTGLSETKINSFAGLNTAVSGAIKQLNKMKEVTVDDVAMMETVLETVGKTLTTAFNVNGSGQNKFVKNMEHIVKLMEQINAMDVGKFNQIFSANEIEATAKQKQQLNEILRLKKQMSTTVDSTSYGDLANKLANAEAKLAQLGMSFDASQQHVYSWEKYVDKAFDSLTKNATNVGTQLSKAFEMKNLSSGGFAELEKLKDKYQELQNIIAKQKSGKFLNEEELRRGNVLISEITSKMKELKVDTKSVKLFEGFQQSASTAQQKINEIKTKMQELKVLETDGVKFNFDTTKIQEAETLISKIKNTPMDADTSLIESDLKKVETLINEVEKELKTSFNNAKIDIKIEGAISDLEKLGKKGLVTTEQFEVLKKKFMDLRSVTNADIKTTGLDNVQKELRETVKEAENADKNMRKINTKAGTMWSNLANAMGMVTPVYLMSRGITQAFSGSFNSIKELDSAFRDLMKVAPESFRGTTQELEAVRVKAGEVARSVASTSTDVIQATSSALQLGIKNIDDAMNYAKNSNIYANVADLTQEEADSQLKSILSAFGGVENAVKPMRNQIKGAGKDYSTMTQYMDLANYAGNNFAVTSGDIGDALKQSASIFQTTGTDLGTAISYIVGAQESVQNASKVGTAFKTIGANLTGVKTSAKTGQMELNKTALALEKLGIKCQTANGDIKSTDEILNELGNIWDTLSKKQQMGIAEAIAGKNHLNTLTAMMNNWQQVLKFQEAYNNNSYLGSADKENARYIDSIEGKLTQLKENVTQLVTTIFKTDMMKGFLDGVNKGIEWLTKFVAQLDKMKLAIPTILALGTAFKGFVMGMTDDNGITSWIDGITSWIGGIKSFLGLAPSMSGATKGIAEGAGEIAKASALATAKTALMNGAIVAGVALLGYGAYKVYDNIANKWKHMAEEAQGVQASAKEQISSLTQEKNTLQNLAKEYESLSKKKNRSAEEDARLLEVRKELAELEPQLVKGFDKEGNPIIQLGGALDDVISKYERSIKLQEQLLQMGKEKEAIANTQEAVKEYEKLYEAKKKIAESEDTTYNPTTGYSVKKTNTPALSEKVYNLFGQEKDLGITKKSIQAYRDALKQRENAYADYYDNNIEAYTSYMEKSTQIEDANLGKLTNNRSFQMATKKQQGLIKQLGGMLDWGALEPNQQALVVSGLGKMGDQLEKSGINIGKYQGYLERLNYEYSNGSMSEEVYTDRLNKMAQELSSMSNIDTETWLKGLKGVPQVLDSGTMAMGEFFKNFNANLSDIGKTDLASMLEKQFDTLSNVQTNLLDQIELNGEVNGEFTIPVDALIELQNEKDLPLQLQGAIDGILGDNKVTEQETTILMKMIAEYQQTGEISQATLDEYIEIVGKGNLSSEILFNLKANVDDNLAKYAFDDAFNSGNKKEREVITNFTTTESGVDMAVIEAKLDMLGLTGKDRTVKKSELIAEAKVLNQQMAEGFAGTLAKFGLGAEKNATVMRAVFEAQMNGNANLGNLQTMTEVAEFFIKNPKIASEVGIKVSGQEDIEKAKKALEELKLNDSDKEIVKNIVANLEEGSISGVEAQINNLSDDAKVAVKTELTENLAKDSLDQMAMEGIEVPVKAKPDGSLESATQSAEQLKQTIESIPDKTFKISDGGSGASANKSVKQVDSTKINDKHFKISDGGTGRSAVKSNNQVASSVNSIPSSKSISISVSGVEEAIARIRKVKAEASSSSFRAPSAISNNPFDLEKAIPVTSTNLFQSTALGVQGAINESAENIENSTGDFSAQVRSDWQALTGMKFNTVRFDTKYITKALKYSIDMFKGLNNEITRMQTNLKLCEAQMENAFGKNKQKYLKSGIKLLEREKDLTKLQYKDMAKVANNLEKRLKKDYGFKFDSHGNLTNYISKLTAYEDKLASLEKKAEASSKKKKGSGKTKAEKDYEAYKDKVEKMKNTLNEYLDLQYNEIPNLEIKWQELKEQIREYNDELEKNKLEDKIYKQVHAVERLNTRIELMSMLVDRYNNRADNTFGSNRIKNLKKQQDYLKQEIELQKEKQKQLKKETLNYQPTLKKYGVKFSKNGNITNQDAILNKYQNKAEYEKVKQYIDDYNELQHTWDNMTNTLDDLKYAQEQLIYDLKQAELEQKVYKFKNAIEETDSSLTKLSNELDLIGSKLNYAFGSDKLRLMDEQIKLLNDSIQETKNKLKSMSGEEEKYQNELKGYGFAFNKDGDITNYDEVMNSLQNSKAKEYVEGVYEDWKNIHQNEIPNAKKSIQDYSNQVKDINKSKLDTTKQIEEEITKIYKDQLDKRKEELQKQTDETKKELEKQKKAYQDSRAEAEYEDKYNEQLQKVQEIQDRIDALRLSDSLQDKATLADLMKQLNDEQKALNDIVQDEIDRSIEQSYDDQMTKLEEANDQAIKDLEEKWSDKAIADAVAQALGTGIFTDIDGNITGLKEALLSFSETSGEAFGVMGEYIQTELITNLGVALDTVKELDNVMQSLGIRVNGYAVGGTNGSMGYIQPDAKTLNMGNININIAGNADGKTAEEIAKEVQKEMDAIIQRL